MPDQDDDFISLAKKRFRQAQEDEHDIRQEAEKDLKFVSGDQWDEQLKQDRVAARRPVLTFNRLPTYVQQVANEARQNKAQAKFAPSDDEATEATAEIFEGIARQIQYASDANIAHETALDYSVAGSFGFFRYLTKFCDNSQGYEKLDTSLFDQELIVVPVFDPFSVYGVLVPAIFGRPIPHAFVIEDVPKDEYRNLYPKSELISSGFDLDRAGDWLSEETVRVAEYWNVTETDKKILLLDDGRVVDASDPDAKDLKIPEERQRNIKQKSVEFCKMNGIEVLPGTKTKWLGSTIPIIPVLGKQLIVKGKPKLFSLIRFQREPQQLINYAKTRIAETLATAPISPFIGAIGAFKGREKEWARINSTVQAFVEYNPMDVQGKPIPPPQRQTFEPPIAALSEFSAQEVDDLKAISGIFDQSLGEGTNDQSGRAIERRQRQSNATNLHFNDNLERALKKGGAVIAELIPPIYGNAPRIVKILGEDEEPDIVKINQKYKDKTGKELQHNLAKGKYELIVTVGRSFSTKRMESFDMMNELVAGNPELLMVVGDLLFKNSDAAGADQMADRFKRYIQLKNPGIIEDDSSEPIPPKAQAMIAKTHQELEAMHAYAQQQEVKVQELEQEKKAKVIDNQFRMEIEKLKIEADITKAEITTKAQEVQTRMQLEHDMWNQLHGTTHEAALQAMTHGHEQDLAAQGQAAAAQSQASDQMHQAGMAEQAASQEQNVGA
jgi:hypothetical protein